MEDYVFNTGFEQVIKFKKYRVRLGVGIFISILFIYLAFRSVDIDQIWQAFETANYWYLLPAVIITFFSHFLRAFRWRYLLDPIRRLDIYNLFSSLMIGYMANLLLPAHSGEFLRAYVLSKKRTIPMSSTLATIVIERIIDVFSLLVLMLLAIFIYPFPPWISKSGYIIFAGTAGLSIFLILLKKATSTIKRTLGFILKLFPESFEQKLFDVIEQFVSGLVPLKRWHNYITVGILSMAIWACYAFVFHLGLEAFHFTEKFDLKWSASLIILVFTTIAVVVPSSPGYVGTYHYLCQISLAMFGVPAGPALSYATVVHGISFFPMLIVGLFFAHYEGMAISKMSEKAY